MGPRQLFNANSHHKLHGPRTYFFSHHTEYATARTGTTEANSPSPAHRGSTLTTTNIPDPNTTANTLYKTTHANPITILRHVTPLIPIISNTPLKPPETIITQFVL
ncbi:hypothetical protein Hypma_001105 [Hypsizygus marmoreus]|uniref:Uncharacterized protein n=1 Tax=Hypsizygus marmoreus TaxID=39966 RepID=A0A369J6B7_HYPMA|nr:hypothetical protein Hypma_001105 [Hypsizygus marmoreus]